MSHHARPAAKDADEQEVFAFPASFAQQRLWYLEQLEPGSPAYNIPQALQLLGPLDEAALHRALKELVRRHEALRTTFAEKDGAPLQIVSPELDLPLPLSDLRGLPPLERAAEVRRLAEEIARRPFDLERGPLVRTGLFLLDKEERVLVLNVHHSICDGWSLGVLFRELSALYRGEALPEPALQQADHAIWERDRMSGDALEQKLAFWRARLAGELSLMELPVDHRPPFRTNRGACLRFDLSPELTDSLVGLGRREGASLYMTLLAAFQLFLSRLCGQADVLVAGPMANRDRPEIEDTVGFLTSTVVLRGNMSGDPSFLEILKRAKESVLTAFAHREVPLDRIVEALRPARAAGQNPLLQVMFAVQRAPESALAIPDIRAKALPIHSGTAKFDLLLEMQELDRGMQGFFEYSADLFEDSTAARLLGHFQTLLASIVAAPERRAEELPLLRAEEERQLLITWNETAAALPATCAHVLIAAQARATPNRIAVEHGGQELTYGELDQRADLLGRRLQDVGVGPDIIVGVCLGRSSDLLVALLAVLKAGGAYLPLDSVHPPDRIGYMLVDSGAQVLLTERSLLADLPKSPARLLLFDEDSAQAGATAMPSGVTPDHLAYAIYTSGSTGRPKGVEVAHRALVNLLCSMQRRPGLCAADRVLAVTTVSFDIAALELFLPLSIGATVLLCSREEAADGDLLLRAIEERRPTVMQATPATYRLLLEAGWRGGPLKLLCGGEALPKMLAAALLPLCQELWNMYGPTETTIWSTCHQVLDAEHISIGRPIDNTRLYVLDALHRPVPIGVVGELHIGGAGVARGYRGSPELTAERFFPDPFSSAAGARMYRTGDLCRRLADGSVDYLRRNDHQVKVRGYRIELGEIESALERNPALFAACVVVREDTPGDRRLVAYIVHRPGESPTASELRAALREELPEYMVPHLIVELDRLPTSPSGKVDRRALPDPLAAIAGLDDYAAPRSAMEQRIASLFQEVIRVARVGLLDNFYNLGGHSLLSVQLVHRIERETGHRLNPRSLVFQNVEQVAAECERARERPEADHPTRPRSLLHAMKGKILGPDGHRGEDP